MNGAGTGSVLVELIRGLQGEGGFRFATMGRLSGTETTKAQVFVPTRKVRATAIGN